MLNLIRRTLMETDFSELTLTEKSRIASSTASTAEDLAQLAKEPSEYIRGAVAENTATPDYILEQLIYDPLEYVRFFVAKNMKLSGRQLALIFEQEHNKLKPDFDIFLAVSDHHNCPSYIKAIVETRYLELYE
jgi:hypothetical protein